MERSGSGASGERYTRSAGGKTCSLLNEWKEKKRGTRIRCGKWLPNDRLARSRDGNWWKESGVKERRMKWGNGEMGNGEIWTWGNMDIGKEESNKKGNE